jgi:hypothetical protein
MLTGREGSFRASISLALIVYASLDLDFQTSHCKRYTVLTKKKKTILRAEPRHLESLQEELAIITLYRMTKVLPPSLFQA